MKEVLYFRKTYVVRMVYYLFARLFDDTETQDILMKRWNVSLKTVHRVVS